MFHVLDRQKLYASGGILSVTSQILIVDLLSGVLNPNNITGVVVLHAERVSATSVEAFILRQYRETNKTGFLKAFSDSPESFTIGFAPLATYMRNLFLRQTILYPRFQLEVAKSLEGRRKAEVIELEVNLTESMITLQAAIMECVEASIGELKKGNTGLETGEWNMDNAIHVNFDSRVMRQLNPVWHRLHPRTKQIAGDLRTLRSMIEYLVTFDSIKFQQFLDTVRAASQGRPGAMKVHTSPWLYMDAADTIFETSRRRVYTGKLQESKGAAALLDPALKPALEELPKWEVLSEVLEEIERDNYFSPVQDDSSGAILIMCSDRAMCAQLREYLESSEREQIEDDDGDTYTRSTAAPMMRRKFRNYVKWKNDFAQVNNNLVNEGSKADAALDQKGALRGKAPPNKRRRVRGSAAVASGPSRSDITRIGGDKDAHIASLLAQAEAHGQSEKRFEFVLDQFNDAEANYEMFDMGGLVVIHPYDGDMDEHILEEIRPRHVIMYEPDVAFVRRIEVYRSCHTDRNIRTYILCYKNSIEEQRYLSAVRREKDAFTRLIRERGVSAWPVPPP
jgi:DNA excision repair protein ERCC-4